jgi:hypothetical protein
MYCLINQYAETILGTILPAHVRDYDWLTQNIDDVRTSDYQRRYRSFWAMNPARLSPDFYATYFTALDEARSQAPTLETLSRKLSDASARRDGTTSFQFSFATKLLHMANPRLPIYDSKIVRFYFFGGAKTTLPLDDRIGCLVGFHGFLVQEYARVLNAGLLKTAIHAFRQQLNPQHFTDEKCIDSLLWAFVTLLEEGGVSRNQIVYR